MTDLKRTVQTDKGVQTDKIQQGAGEDNRGAEFGTDERATRGTDRDLDKSGHSKNQGHGHPREERNQRGG